MAGIHLSILARVVIRLPLADSLVSTARRSPFGRCALALWGRRRVARRSGVARRASRLPTARHYSMMQARDGVPLLSVERAEAGAGGAREGGQGFCARGRRALHQGVRPPSRACPPTRPLLIVDGSIGTARLSSFPPARIHRACDMCRCTCVDVRDPYVLPPRRRPPGLSLSLSRPPSLPLLLSLSLSLSLSRCLRQLPIERVFERDIADRFKV